MLNYARKANLENSNERVRGDVVFVQPFLFKCRQLKHEMAPTRHGKGPEVFP